VKLVQQAQGSSTNSAIADQVTGWFVPAVIAVAIATFIICYNIMGNVTLVDYTVGVLIIACPVPWVWQLRHQSWWVLAKVQKTAF